MRLIDFTLKVIKNIRESSISIFNIFGFSQMYFLIKTHGRASLSFATPM